MTSAGGDSGFGTIFGATVEGDLLTLFSFSPVANGLPQTGLLMASDNSFYGATSLGIFRFVLGGVAEVIAPFPPATGLHPRTGLALGLDGSLYGTTAEGGRYNAGTLFRVGPDGNFTTLYTFDVTNGMTPRGTLIVGPDGSVYGTTYAGGSNSAGTVFRLSADGSFTNLASFGGDKGANPWCQLFLDRDGNLFGTTSQQGPGGFGTVFKLNHDGSLSVLASFHNSDGATPEDGVIRAADGNFYGTTTFGGAYGAGTVFRVKPQGALTNLISFNSTNGAFPVGTLTQGTDGSLYGVTFSGGAQPYGTFFKVTTNGVFTTLHELAQPSEGYSPSGTLILGPDGNFYGTTRFGGTNTNSGPSALAGTVFKLTPSGSITQLAAFNGFDGSQPLTPLVLGRDGNLYGTTLFGGSGRGGTIFRVRLIPMLTAITQSPDGTIRLTGIGPSESAWQLLSSPDLSAPMTSWTVLTNGVFDTNRSFTYTDSVAQGTRFYRVAAQ
jgi:uncharacterized repeat protein (TIGR03803 family)